MWWHTPHVTKVTLPGIAVGIQIKGFRKASIASWPLFRIPVIIFVLLLMIIMHFELPRSTSYDAVSRMHIINVD